MSSVKKLINAPDDAVNESLSGLSLLYPQLCYHPSKRVTLVPDWKARNGKVAIVTGGGGGHEPFAAGFVGSGLLTAAISGPIYASPPSNHILHALRCVSTNNTAGILVIVPNYTGDCLNFGAAIEKARKDGVSVTELTVGEDCSIPISEIGRAGRRGLVGMLFVAKVAGALAERGLTLNSIAQCAEIVTSNIATYAVGLTACALPGQGRMFEVSEDEVEMGMGVHGEAGYKRMKLGTASQAVSLMLEQILKTLSLISGESVAVIVNNFGATSQLEQGIVVNEVVTQLAGRGIQPLRVYAGVLMTSLDGAGVQISVLRLADHYETSLLSCLDEATDAPCWPGSTYSVPPPLTINLRDPFEVDRAAGDEKKRIARVGPALTETGENLLAKCLANACSAISKYEDEINELDSGCGDGDCGSTLRRLAEGISSSLETLPLSHPSSLLTALSVIAEETMGGTSGAVYSLMFTTAAAELELSNESKVGPESWARAWRGGIDGIMRYSKAKLGDRTMLDALEPACTEFEDHCSTATGFGKEVLLKTAEAARAGSEATKLMEARAGRASYVKQDIYLKKVDAGAFAAAAWIEAIVWTVLESNY